MKSAHPIRINVDGAPFRIGDLVHIVRLSDSTADADFLRKCGRIVHFEYSCGCGQKYPDDPMIGINFAGEIAEFWKEEIQRIDATSEPFR
jgi:hypothetical protein